MKKKLIYLDNASTTQLDDEVIKSMKHYFKENFGNPSSICDFGRDAKKELDLAREKVSKLINSKTSEIVFCSGGTESINLSIRGVIELDKKRNHIISTTIEHHAVLHTLKYLETKGNEVTLIDVDGEGLLNFEKLKKSIKKNTKLISIMYANNEIGSIQPIKKISAWLKKLNKERKKKKLDKILFHTDACQAGGLLNVDVKELGVDLLTLNGSKIYGPKQSGILFFKEGVELLPLIFGGGQERNLRSGTENMIGIAGFAKALEISQKSKENKKLIKLNKYILNKIKEDIKDSRFNGPIRIEDRLSNNVNVSFQGVDGELLLQYLNKKGICVSTGSACSSNNDRPSHVLEAINCPIESINGSIRITLGKKTTQKDIDYFLYYLIKGVKEIRKSTTLINDLKKITKNQISAGCVKMK